METIILEILFGCFIFVLSAATQILTPYFFGESIKNMYENNKKKNKKEKKILLILKNTLISIIGTLFNLTNIKLINSIFEFTYKIVNNCINKIISILTPNRLSNLLSNGRDEGRSFRTMISVYVVISIFCFLYTSIIDIFLPNFDLNILTTNIQEILNNNPLSLTVILKLIPITILNFFGKILAGESPLLSLLGFMVITITYYGIVYHGMCNIDQIGKREDGILKIKSFNIRNLLNMTIIGLVICLFLKIIIQYNFLKSFFVIKNAFDIELNISSIATTVVPLKITEVAVDAFCGNPINLSFTNKLDL